MIVDVSDSCFFVGARWDGMEGFDIGLRGMVDEMR